MNDPSIRLENVHSTTAIVDDDNATVRVAADTLRTKQLASTNPKQQQQQQCNAQLRLLSNK